MVGFARHRMSELMCIIRTPLHWASYNGRFKTVELLLLYGADVNSRDSNGKSAMDLTAHPSIKQILLGTL